MNQGSILALAVAISALNLFVLSPGMGQLAGPLAANLVYMLIRVAVIGGVAFVMTRKFGRKRFQAIAAASFVAFIDHAVLKALLAMDQLRAEPGLMVFGLLKAFVANFPIIMIVAFLGAEAGTRTKPSAPQTQLG